MERHFGMDWLRIGAFALLILYHIGMVFVPWGFHIKTAQPINWVEIPMLMSNPWRLTLLFVVSGYASRALFAKSSGIGAFMKNRNARLMIPLVFSMAVIVPPQTWVEIVGKHGYPHDYLWFWTRDYFRLGTLFGIVMPTWNHLWFVVYLWVYTLALGLLMLVPRSGKLQPVFDKILGGSRALWVPVVFLLITQYWLFHRDDDTHDLFNDGIAHLQYFPAFLFGFGLAGSRAVMDGLAQCWKVSAGVALGCYAIIAGLLIAYPDFSFPTRAIAQVFVITREIDVWIAITALIGIAERFGNRDHRWRATLAEATFPFYIIHQTAIVLVEFWIRPLDIGALAEFAILVPATVVACWGFYLLGREVNWLRPLIGLKRRVPPSRPAMIPHIRARPDVT